MVESTTKMLDKWNKLVSSGMPEIDVESEISHAAGEIIAQISFGISFESGRKVFDKLREMQVTLFQSNRYVGVPYSKLLCPIQSLKAKKLGKEIDGLLLSIINDRKKHSNNGGTQQDLLGLLLADSVVGGNLGTLLTARELVDECKTFFFGGHETTALALTWTMLLLATHPEWQTQLREEIKQVLIGQGDDQLDFTKLGGLKKVIKTMA